MSWSTGRVEESEYDEMNWPVSSMNRPTSNNGIVMNSSGDYVSNTPPMLMTQPIAYGSSSVGPSCGSETHYCVHGDSISSMYLERGLHDDDNGPRTMGSNPDELHTWWQQSVPMNNQGDYQYSCSSSRSTDVQWPEGLQYPWEDDFTFDLPPSTTMNPSSDSPIQPSDQQAHHEGQSQSPLHVESHIPIVYYPVLVPVPVNYPVESGMPMMHPHPLGSCMESNNISMHHQPASCGSSYRPPSVLFHVWRAMSRFVHHCHYAVSDLGVITNDSTIVLKLIDKFTQALQIYVPMQMSSTDDEEQRLNSYLDQVFLSTMEEHIGHNPLPIVHPTITHGLGPVPMPMPMQMQTPTEESQYPTPLIQEISSSSSSSSQQTIHSFSSHSDTAPTNVYLYDHRIHRDINNNVSKTHRY